MSAIIRTLDPKFRLCLPPQWAEGQETVGLVLLPQRTLAVLTLEQLVAMRAMAKPPEQIYLRALVAVTPARTVQQRGSVCRRVTIPPVFRNACQFGPLEELVVADWEDAWGWSLRVMSADAWESAVGDLFAVARHWTFPVARGAWEAAGEMR